MWHFCNTHEAVNEARARVPLALGVEASLASKPNSLGRY